MAIGAFLDVICETFNNQGIPSLIDINGSKFDGITDYPYLAHGDINDRDIVQLSTFLKDMIGSGVLIPDEELEDYVRSAANLPERTNVPDIRQKDPAREDLRRMPERTGKPEVDPEGNEAEGENSDDEGRIAAARKRLGR